MSANRIDLELFPLGRRLKVGSGESLQSVLFSEGVEFPCGGNGRCRGCRVRVLAGAPPPTPEDLRMLEQPALNQGWRLACQLRPVRSLKVELAQWQTAILAHDQHFDFTPGQGLGVAVDVGTTTLAAQLLNLETGQVLAVETALNAQAVHGTDVMSRLQFALAAEGHQTLSRQIRIQVGQLIQALFRRAEIENPPPFPVRVVGNTAMHHLFCGLPTASLTHSPFHPETTDAGCFESQDLGWPPELVAEVVFLPCLGGFVGSDILAGILATRLHQRARPCALMDLGTNGEIVVANGDQLLCASTAAGPAFEGARISMGMRAATGAIAGVRQSPHGFECDVLGGGKPRGLCGSGLVDAVACGLAAGDIQVSGRLANGTNLQLAAPVQLSQADIRELQLAKGAIAAGIRLLTAQSGLSLEDLDRVFVAGAFGNNIRCESANRIGLLPFRLDQIEVVGNTALLGAKLALFNPDLVAGGFQSLRAVSRHVGLEDDPEFQNVFVEEMSFPAPAEASGSA